MNIVDTIGLTACIITTAYTSLGMPVQIFQNYKTKSTAGLSLPMMCMALCTFTSWVIYGFVKPSPDWYVIVSNGPGVLCIGCILLQFYLYRGTSVAKADLPKP
jgi:uncharacterized protein with PQ loop repeat